MQKKDPIISVLMPTLNSEAYIAEAIESILNQTFTDFEFIIVNGPSDDNTLKIIERYAKKDKRIKLIKCKEKTSVTDALNQGLRYCNGKYIARMDSDDISLPDRFEKQVKYMNQNPNVGILGTAIQIFGQQNKVLFYKKHITLLDLVNKCNLAHPSVMFRKSVLDKYDLKYLLTSAEDYDLWARAIKITNIHNLPVVLLKYRFHNHQATNIYSAGIQKNAEKIKNDLISFITDIPELQKKIKRIAHDAMFYNPSCLDLHMLLHHPFRYLRLKHLKKLNQQ